MTKTLFVMMGLCSATAFAQTGRVGINTEKPTATLNVKAKTNDGSKVLELENNQATKLVSVLDNGNTGIGTTTPSQKLEVIGNIKTSSLSGTGTRPVVASADGVLQIGGVVKGLGNQSLDTSEQKVTCNNTTKGLYTNAWGRFLCVNNQWIYEGIGFFNNGFINDEWVSRNPYHDYVRVLLNGGELAYQQTRVYTQNPGHGANYNGSITGTNTSITLPTSVSNTDIHMQRSSYTGELIAFYGNWINIQGPSHPRDYPQNTWLIGIEGGSNGNYITYPYLMIPFFFDVVIK